MDQTLRTVLIIDDSPEDRQLYRRYLMGDREYSYTVLEAELGGQGLEMWQQHQPDAVLLDYRLPDMDGLEFLAQFEQSWLPMIMVTGCGNEAIAVQAIKAGAQDYLVKEQITPEGLQLAVNGAIETVQLRTQLQQRISRERVITHITQQIHKSLNLDEILQTTVSEVRQFLQTNRVIVFRLAPSGFAVAYGGKPSSSAVSPDGHGTVVAESVEAEWRSLLSLTIYDPCFAENYIEPFRQGLVTAKTDIHDGNIDPCHVELLTQFQVRANLVVPIVHEDELWGMLIAHHCASPREWQTLDMDLLRQLADQISIAIRQAELYQQAQNELAERKQVEEILRSSEERLRLALEAAHMGTWDWNILRGQIHWSANLEALFGLAPGEFDGSYSMFVSSLHPDDRDRVLEAINRAVTTGADYNIEFRVVYPNGTIRWALSLGKVVYDQAGQPVRMAGVDIDITERKKSETELREKQAWLKLGQKATKSGLWDWDVTTNIATITEEYCTLFGLDPATKEISSEDWLRLLHPDDCTSIREYNARLTQQQQKDYEFEYRILHPNGIRWVLARGEVFYNQKGEAVRLFGNVQDISDRKLAELALRDNEQLLRLALSGARAGSWDWEIQTGKIVWSPENYTLYGLDQALGSPQYEDWYNAIHPDDRERANSEVQRVVEQHLPEFNCEFRIVHPQRGIYWLHGLGRVTFDTHGEAVRLSGINLDITARKRAEEELRQSEARYRYLAEAIPQLVWTCDVKGYRDYVSQRWCEYTGLTVEQSLGLGWLCAVYPDDELSAKDAWTISIKNSTLYKHEYRLRRDADGSYRWHLAMGLPLKDEQGQVVKWFGTCTDIHDGKELEMERDRILQLEQVARNEAERANRIKDEFLAILSHELRSPLNPILGWTKLLQTRKLNPSKTTEALATIERNAKLQTQLIDDLLDIARVLRGKLSLKTDAVNLAFVIESAIDTVRTAAVAKSILILPVLPNIGQVSGDSVRLQQIIWNLLSNAIKFTPNGGQVEIRLERIGDQAQITVTDTGKGISPDFLPYIFESFRQEDVSVTRTYGGLGLGLAIVRHLVEAHGGKVAADSPGIGLGATFTVNLPLLNVEPEINQTDNLLEGELDLTGIRVLTIDDDPDTRELLMVLLSQYGAEVMTVASSPEFLAALESFRPDVLVSDIGMPEVDGYTLLRNVRSLPPERGGQIPAIALTAYAGDLDQQKALKAGFQKHLAKPIEPHQLIQMVFSLTS
ncbi:MAG: PAS domain-containing protein [Stigonema ocellatum SAG 48.90 = DSM 106950]|nr:PAS domain-containing protein [Stigonema ocellatum SAG 48.90 = DSM 106950]